MDGLSRVYNILPHILALQSLTLRVSYCPLGSRIDLTRHSSLTHLHIFAPRSIPKIVNFYYDDVIRFLKLCDFAPSLASLTLNVPVRRVLRPKCWTTAALKPLFTSNAALDSLSELNFNLVEGCIYRPSTGRGNTFHDEQVNAESVLRDLSKKAKTKWFKRLHNAEAVRLGVYRPSWEDRLSTLYSAWH